MHETLTMTLPDGRVIPFDPEQFRGWLKQYQPQDVVGLANTAYCCPLASWLRETYQEWFGVDGAAVFLDRTHGERVVPWSQRSCVSTLPQWMSVLIEHVDDQYWWITTDELTYQTPMTAQQMLMLLDTTLASLQ